ncbi:MAG: MarR family EPS-associated transcriptional regulator [Nitrospirae bacterium]|nr:MAG: MarR family EPS-associated transcriptional regulator [Nitrospirota bacterium]
MDEHHLKLLRELTKEPGISQRELARRLGISLGKVNYLLKALINKGYVKIKRFKNSNNKLAYMYILTPRGISQKLELTYKFLKRKSEEYERLKREIEELKNDLET